MTRKKGPYGGLVAVTVTERVAINMYMARCQECEKYFTVVAGIASQSKTHCAICDAARKRRIEG